jgi:hypothetical protein
VQPAVPDNLIRRRLDAGRDHLRNDLSAVPVVVHHGEDWPHDGPQKQIASARVYGKPGGG